MTALDVQCRVCGAHVEKPCRTLGTRAKRSIPHQERIDDAEHWTLKLKEWEGKERK